MIEDFATMAGVELLVIDEDTNIRAFRQELKWNDTYYGLCNGFIS